MLELLVMIIVIALAIPMAGLTWMFLDMFRNNPNQGLTPYPKCATTIIQKQESDNART